MSSSSFQSVSGQSLGGLDQLKAQASRDPRGSIRETARQFESLFMQEVMKSMRASTLSSGMLDNSATQLGTEMLDSQFAALEPPGPDEHAIVVGIAESPEAIADRIVARVAAGD